MRFPQAVSEDGSLWARFGVAYQPAWVFVSDDGHSQVVPGAIPEQDLKQILDQADRGVAIYSSDPRNSDA